MPVHLQLSTGHHMSLLAAAADVLHWHLFGGRVAVTDCNSTHLYHCVQDSSTGAGAGYEQDVQQFKNGDLKKGAKDNIKKVGSTINKKANQGGTKVGVHHCLQNN